MPAKKSAEELPEFASNKDALDAGLTIPMKYRASAEHPIGYPAVLAVKPIPVYFNSVKLFDQHTDDFFAVMETEGTNPYDYLQSVLNKPNNGTKSMERLSQETACNRAYNAILEMQDQTKRDEFREFLQTYDAAKVFGWSIAKYTDI